MAVAEDLMGGIDVTSVATVPAGQRSVGHVRRSRADGVVAGLAVAAAAIDAVCGDEASDFEYLVADGDRVAPGQTCRPGHGADAWTADRRAHGAQPAVPPLGGRHADPPLGRRPRRDAVRRARHAQDDARAAGPREVRRALRRRRQPPHGAVRRRARQGQPRARRRRRRRGVRRRASARGDDPGRDRGRLARRAAQSPSTPAPTSCCSTTSTLDEMRAGGRGPRRVRPPRSCSRPAAA